MVSGQGDKAECAARRGAGAYDFLWKPVDMDEERVVLQRCVYVQSSSRNTTPCRVAQRTSFEEMLGISSADAGGVSPSCARSAPTERPGADPRRERHGQGDGGAGPSSARSCRTVPSWPSTATRSRRTCWRASSSATRRAPSRGAHAAQGPHRTGAGGTLFLDEIGELPAPGQVKLLRFLQEKRFQRVGGRQEIQTTRVVAATNVNLQNWSRAASSRGHFGWPSLS